LNNAPFIKPSTPIIFDAHLNTLGESTANNPWLMELSYGEVVDVVFQNARALNNVSEHHPWHIHGHVSHSHTRLHRLTHHKKKNSTQVVDLIHVNGRGSGCWGMAWVTSIRRGTRLS
jgi:hypothetical protein